jgi:hypothetical protein
VRLLFNTVGDRIGADQVSMNGIGIESRSHRKDSVMDKKVGFPTESSQVLTCCVSIYILKRVILF